MADVFPKVEIPCMWVIQGYRGRIEISSAGVMERIAFGNLSGSDKALVG